MSSFSIGGRGGYFFINDWSLGLNLSFGTSSQGDVSNTFFSAGPFTRYYFNGVFFVGGFFSFVSSTTDNSGFESDLDYTQFGFEVGYPIWVVESVAIEPALLFRRRSGNDVSNSNALGLNVGFNLYF